jgi:hypothetical protein
MTCQARPTREGTECARCRIRWDRDDVAPPCPLIVLEAPLVPDFVSALAPDFFSSSSNKI